MIEQEQSAHADTKPKLSLDDRFFLMKNTWKSFFQEIKLDKTSAFRKLYLLVDMCEVICRSLKPVGIVVLCLFIVEFASCIEAHVVPPSISNVGLLIMMYPIAWVLELVSRFTKTILELISDIFEVN
jgi:hypothetical protein